MKMKRLVGMILLVLLVIMVATPAVALANQSLTQDIGSEIPTGSLDQIKIWVARIFNVVAGLGGAVVLYYIFVNAVSLMRASRGGNAQARGDAIQGLMYCFFGAIVMFGMWKIASILKGAATIM